MIDFWVCWVFVSAQGLFSSCSERGPLFIAVRGPLTVTASLVAEHRLQTRRLSSCGSRGPAAPRHAGSSQTRARTRVPCIGRQILNHCATREARRRPFDFSSRASHLALSLHSHQANSASGFIGESIKWHFKICSGAYF